MRGADRSTLHEWNLRLLLRSNAVISVFAIRRWRFNHVYLLLLKCSYQALYWASSNGAHKSSRVAQICLLEIRKSCGAGGVRHSRTAGRLSLCLGRARNRLPFLEAVRAGARSSAQKLQVPQGTLKGAQD